MANNLKILPMTKEHVEEVYAIEALSFAVPWPKESMVEELSRDFAHYFVAVLDGFVVGFCGMWVIVIDGHIVNIAVDPAFRNKGIGGKLIEKVVEHARSLELISLSLEVRKSNIPAQNLYEKHGFVPSGIKENYYEDTEEDAVSMWRLL